MSRRPLLMLLVLLGALAATAAAQDAPAQEALAFGAPIAVPHFGGEPSLVVAPDGAAYVTYPDWPGSRVWRLDAGATAWRDLGRPNLGFGGGDEALAVGPDGTLALAGMYMGPARTGHCTSITLSRDRGETWGAPVPAVCVAERVDRPWVAIDGHGHVWVVQQAYCCVGAHTAHWSPDGVTFAPAGIAHPRGGFPGNLFADRDGGRVLAATSCFEVGPCLTSTTSAAPTPVWAPSVPIRVGGQPRGLNHLTGAVDDEGGLYLAWTEIRSGRTHVFAARSADGGLTWSAPSRVSSGNVATMPWIVAGAAGRAAVAWYEADRGALDANEVPADARWHVKVGVRTDWGPEGAWEVAQASVTTNHRGPLCTHGARCYAMGLDRDLLDFLGAAVGPDGRVHVAWSDDVAWRVQYAVQATGPRLR